MFIIERQMRDNFKKRVPLVQILSHFDYFLTKPRKVLVRVINHTYLKGKKCNKFQILPHQKILL